MESIHSMHAREVCFWRSFINTQLQLGDRRVPRETNSATVPCGGIQFGVCLHCDCLRTVSSHKNKSSCLGKIIGL